MLRKAMRIQRRIHVGVSLLATQDNPSGSSGCDAPILDGVEMPATRRILMNISSKAKCSDRFLSGTLVLAEKDTEQERDRTTPNRSALFAETMGEQVKSFDGRIDLPDSWGSGLRGDLMQSGYLTELYASKPPLVSLKQDPIEISAV